MSCLSAVLRPFCALGVILSAASALAAPPGPSVTITPSKITASGVARGAQVLFFGVGVEPKGLHIVRHRWSAVAADTDKDGSVSYDLDNVTYNAVWIVVELESAHYTVASTPGFPTLRARRRRSELRKGMAGAVDQFAYQNLQGEFLYFVPGGAWELEIGDGDAHDADHQLNGTPVVDLGDAVSLLPETDKKSRAFTPGGTLIMIEPSRVELFEMRLDGSILGGAH